LPIMTNDMKIAVAVTGYVGIRIESEIEKTL
jgi:hypothetical protein